MNQEETMLLHKERYKETIKNLTVRAIFSRGTYSKIRMPASMSLELFWKTKN